MEWVCLPGLFERLIREGCGNRASVIELTGAILFGIRVWGTKGLL